MLTPLPWRQPWKVASQVATLDQLSGGRAILTVGPRGFHGGLAADRRRIGSSSPRGDARRGHRSDARALARSGTYHGQVFETTFERSDQIQVARPVQSRVPIWVVGLWPRPKSMRRVLRCDGIVPQFEGGEHRGSPTRITELRRWLQEHDASPTFDVIAEGETPADDVAGAAAAVSVWADAGCTWWLESRWDMPHHGPVRFAQVRNRLEAGPPRVDPA
jgi:alkanesulfonate monooxygenase SsuD/methylene tetrahydromethanopterin reductase-like flavin-dependent oxidoreductase (luciferase family)